MESDIEELVARKKPLVLMDSYIPGLSVPHVVVDNEGGVMQGMEHLVSRHYKRIAFITIDLNQIQMKLREHAYCNALKKHKISFDPELVLKLKYNYRNEEAIEEISDFMIRNKDIEAVFFSTYYLGITGLESIKRLGLQIPMDIAVVCFDDHDIFRLYPPGITIIAQPTEQLAKKAIEILMQQIEGTDVPVKKNQVALAPKFIVRGST
jgi:LacI family transcriptional regulator